MKLKRPGPHGDDDDESDADGTKSPHADDEL
jgi:hypothetical protein